MDKYTDINNILSSIESGELKTPNAFSMLKKYIITDNHRLDDKFIYNICLSYRHDFGLLNDEDKKLIEFEAKEWIRAILNNLPYA